MLEEHELSGYSPVEALTVVLRYVLEVAEGTHEV